VLGHRPNKASWYAVTWQGLDPHPSYDAGATLLFRRGAYRGGEPLLKNASLIPARGIEQLLIAPAGGIGRGAVAPASGAMGGVSDAALHRQPETI
jgi:hypothetical protein